VLFEILFFFWQITKKYKTKKNQKEVPYHQKKRRVVYLRALKQILQSQT